jgi:2-amino-4-hydroxy-6-hydroxymethyldihydropteridine diphosphokinase
MAFVNIYFSLGSNIGDRERNIMEALRLMDEAFGVHYSALSRLIETKPMGFSGGKFLNAAVLYRVFRPAGSAEEAALGILDTVKMIERSMGRTDSPEYDPDGNRIYHSRIIDIDILFYGILWNIKPTRRVSLRIHVDQKHFASSGRKTGCEIDGCSGLSHSTLLISDNNCTIHYFILLIIALFTIPQVSP